MFCLGCALDLLLGREPPRRKEPYDLAKEEGVGKLSLSKKRVQIPKGLLTIISKGSQGPGTSDNRPDFCESPVSSGRDSVGPEAKRKK